MSGKQEAPRHLVEVRGNVTLAAVCVGQFHAPCQIEPDRLLVLADPPLQQVLQTLGLQVREVDEPFTPVPFFAPEASAREAARRGVHTHVSFDADGYVPAESGARGSNA